MPENAHTDGTKGAELQNHKHALMPAGTQGLERETNHPQLLHI